MQYYIPPKSIKTSLLRVTLQNNKDIEIYSLTNIKDFLNGLSTKSIRKKPLR